MAGGTVTGNSLIIMFEIYSVVIQSQYTDKIKCGVSNQELSAGPFITPLKYTVIRKLYNNNYREIEYPGVQVSKEEEEKKLLLFPVNTFFNVHSIAVNF